MRFKLHLLSISNLLLLLLFLCGMNFKAKFFYFAFAIFIVQCFTKRNLHVSASASPYLFFSVIYAIYGYISSGPMESIRRLSFLLMYIVGYDSTISKCSGEKAYENVEKWMRDSLLVFSTGAFLHYFLNMLTNFGKSIGRNTVDVWSGEILSATGQAALVCPMVGIAIASIVAPIQNKKRTVPIIVLVIIFVYNTMLAGRTLIAMVLLDAVFCIVLFTLFEQNSSKKIKTWAILIIIILLVIGLYQIDILGIKSLFEKSNLYARFFDMSTSGDMFEDKRMFRKSYFLIHMWEHMFGGMYMNEQVGYAHDLLLDAYDEAGIMALIPLIIIVFSSIKKAVVLVKSKVLSVQYNILILSFYFCVFLQFFMEPILAGERWLFAGFCLVNGCITAILKLKNNNMLQHKVDNL